MTEAGRGEKEKHVENQVGLQCRKKHTNTLTVNKDKQEGVHTNTLTVNKDKHEGVHTNTLTVNKDKHEGVHTNTLTVNKDKHDGHQSTSVHAVLLLFSEKAKPPQI